MGRKSILGKTVSTVRCAIRHQVLRLLLHYSLFNSCRLLLFGEREVDLSLLPRYIWGTTIFSDENGILRKNDPYWNVEFLLRSKCYGYLHGSFK
ncbi:hypothetical protein TNIN_371791 [Trichonephila inaurata madagascariensis]|uniref:Uncharacterized protein n=1 Tax=Trichonephila inaurata madagascariensis TaxID=2747483 RepID=A0A8X6MBV9_9ARAC|nr:hypothetical protein TNIN_371791 [Trichonephila inaurata madagascariensis]